MSKGLKRAFLVLSLTICFLSCSVFGFNALSVNAEGANQVTATTNASIAQGNSGTCYIYIDSLESISALDVAVYFDSEKVSVTTIYNSVTAEVYDSVKTEDSVKFSYVFNDKGSSTKTRLFYFYYKVLDTAAVGETYFDIVVGEAYDFSLNDVDVSGSRCAFNVAEKVTTKSCSISSMSSVSTSVNGEFSLSYRLSSYQIVSGSVCISYDSELFELLNVVNGAFLSNKVVDVNTDLTGAVYISFVGTEYISKYDFITLTFKTRKNVMESSKIKFTVTELYNKELTPINCIGYTTSINVAFDSTYTADSPSVVVASEYKDNKVTAMVKLASDSHLGAGDFVLSFDKSVLAFESYEKVFTPSFFNVNEKDALNGKLKFSIVSLDDITTEETMIIVIFNTVQSCTDRQTEISITGSGFADSLTNPITLHLVNSSFLIPSRHVESAIDEIPPTCIKAGLGEGKKCGLCDKLLMEQEVIPALGHNEVTHEAKAPTCTEIGWNEYVTCTRCDYTTYDKIEALGHDYNVEETVELRVYTCKVCSFSYSEKIEREPVYLSNTEFSAIWGKDFTTSVVADKPIEKGMMFEVGYNCSDLALKQIVPSNKNKLAAQNGVATVTVLEDVSVGEVVFDVTFSVPEDIRSGSYEILSCGECAFTPLVIYEMGDVNMDGKINARDVTVIRQYVVKMIDLTDVQKEYANVYVDYDAEGKPSISSRDAMLIQQYVVKMDVQLGNRHTATEKPTADISDTEKAEVESVSVAVSDSEPQEDLRIVDNYVEEYCEELACDEEQFVVVAVDTAFDECAEIVVTVTVEQSTGEPVIANESSEDDTDNNSESSFNYDEMQSHFGVFFTDKYRRLLKSYYDCVAFRGKRRYAVQ